MIWIDAAHLWAISNTSSWKKIPLFAHRKSQMCRNSLGTGALAFWTFQAYLCCAGERRSPMYTSLTCCKGRKRGRKQGGCAHWLHSHGLCGFSSPLSSQTQQPWGSLSSHSLPLLYKLISFHLLMWLPAKSNLRRLPLTSFCPELKIVRELLYGSQQKTALVAFNQLHHDYAVICVFYVFRNVFFATSAYYSRFMEERRAHFLLCKPNILLYQMPAKVLLIYFVSDCCGKQHKMEYIS